MLLIFSAWPFRRVAGGRFRVRNGFRIAYKKRDQPTVKELLASANAGVRIARPPPGIFGARRRGAQKEVTSGLTWVIILSLGKSPKFLKNEAFVVIGKAARRGHRENPA